MDKMEHEMQKQDDKQRGATLIEYAVLAALIVIVALAAIQLVGERVSAQFSSIAESI